MVEFNASKPLCNTTLKNRAAVSLPPPNRQAVHQMCQLRLAAGINPNRLAKGCQRQFALSAMKISHASPIHALALFASRPMVSW